MTLDEASCSRKRVYSPRNRLRRDMVAGHPIFELFVSGSSSGSDKAFHWMICQRDVSMESRGQLSSPDISLANGTGSLTWLIAFGTTRQFSKN